MKKEMIWKDVVEFENIYKVNNSGEVLTVSTEFRNVKPGKLLKPTLCKNGYSIVRLWKNGKSTSRYVHRVVMESFIGSCPNGQEVNHINGMRSDNRLENLEYVTRSQNNLHSYRFLGRQAHPSYGEKHPFAKLNWVLVDKIREEYPVEKSYAKLAKKYGVDWTTIKSIVLCETWREEYRNVNL
jgi:hypothetical protein